MNPKIFINLHVQDLSKSMDFYTTIGFTNNPQFTDETAACMAFSEEIFVMLLTHNKFKEFTPKQISDATKSTEVMNCLSVESKEAVIDMAEKAINAGGSAVKEPLDYGFMYSKSFNDLDGHIWEILWMDPSKAQ